ncbi:uncharacterized protein LOC122502144 [Leptopilina heterotoma]|uniref:uncharacterized protein LOC122502144 n=1 Tax=Leptopilina heterotoma TaxID=63436 RepID=UPI001CA95F65|nr:uncharacterized protein LOC122502144 [Leptopilina heterotoma]
MIRLTIICLVIALSNGAHVKLNNTDLEELRISVSESKEYLKNLSVNEDSAVFFGNDKAGKSTLINYLIGTQLKGVKELYNRTRIVKANSNSSGPEINAKSTLNIRKPTKWISKKLPNLTLWETTPCIIKDLDKVKFITNEIYIHQLVKSVKSLKIILVVDFTDIKDSDDINLFTTLIDYVANIFGNRFEEYFPAVSVIFTKVPEYVQETRVNYETIKVTLESYLELNKAQNSEVSINFIRYLLDNEDRIALFKRLNDEGNVTSKINVNIFPTINNSRSIKENCLQEIRLSNAASNVALFDSSTIKEILLEEDKKNKS